MGFCDNMKDDLPEANSAERFFFFATFVSGEQDPFSELSRLADNLKDAKGTSWESEF